MPIYEPRGRARDDSPRAFNIYTGCDHKCKYCYAPAVFMKKRDDWFAKEVFPRKTLLDELKNDIPKNKNLEWQVLYCFTCDPYQSANGKYKMTRLCLQQFLKYRIPVAILSKGGGRILQDVDMFKQFGEHIKIGQTLTFADNDKSLEWEPGAAIPKDRIETAKILQKSNIKTFASIEPVIEPKESIKIIEKTLPYIDEYRVGKLNKFKGMDKQTDWKQFLKTVVDMIRNAKKKLYIKTDLADYYNEYLTKEEMDRDKYAVRWCK